LEKRKKNGEKMHKKGLKYERKIQRNFKKAGRKYGGGEKTSCKKKYVHMIGREEIKQNSILGVLIL